ncbi:DUF177 domain-containing protein [Salipiger sp. P9]|uniref:YceD family protein n=1 Tax=Salipiger pentaromativorans TaxID=2943193 RepID=UPI002156FEAA|nr:DUF177 domain-containing protein [Salipiger pentaromativorans]MCR8547121.1 DUF177 domain-containing protein [Salipiger pentaromativorans]
MSRSDSATERLRVAALRNNTPTAFDLRPDETARAALADALGLLSLRKLRLSGEIRPEGRGSWRLEGMLGATVTQPCVVTLAPVTTRIDEPVERLWRPAEGIAAPAEGSETETPEEDAEPLPEVIDLGAVLSEALSLALPLYPHSEAGAAAAADMAEEASPEAEEARPNPFAALAGLRDKLGDGGDGGENGAG